MSCNCGNTSGSMNNCCETCPDIKATGKEKECAELHSYNNEEIKPLACTAEFVNPCDQPRFLGTTIKKITCMFKNNINQICGIWKTINNILMEIQQIKDALLVNGKYEVKRRIDVGSNPKLITPVDLGKITDDTKIYINWNLGSTNATETYTVGQLKTDNCHILSWNLNDGASQTYVYEVFTRIQNGNKLWITAVHGIKQNVGEAPKVLAVPWKTGPNDVYYDTQDPKYVAQSESGYQNSPVINWIEVGDLVEPITFKK